MKVFTSAAELTAAIGETIGPGEPFLVDQHRIQAFADATDDHQWIHLDEQRAAAGPFGGRVAHGFLTLSLLPVLTRGLYRLEGATMAVNYGLNRVRFPAPLLSGATVRAQAVIAEVTPVGTGILQLVATISITATDADGAPAVKPCCVAESVSRVSFQASSAASATTSRV